MNKDMYLDFKKYVEILERIDKSAENNEILSFTPEERDAVRRVQVAASNDEELNKLLAQIKENGSNREKLVEEFFNKTKKSNSEEEEIAKVFGVDSRNIQTRTLDSGKVIFSFYDFKLNRLVVLENSKNGKSLSEYLEELQKENEEYQSTDEIGNATNIMDDQRKNTSMELEMIPINEVSQHENEIDQLSNEDREKLFFLLKNAESLGAVKVNIANLIYIDKDDNIREIVFDKDKNAVAADPDTDKVEDTPEKENGDRKEPQNEMIKKSEDELNSMFEEQPKLEEAQENSMEKPKVLVKRDITENGIGTDSLNELGLVNNVIFILIAALAVTLTIIGVIYLI